MAIDLISQYEVKVTAFSFVGVSFPESIVCEAHNELEAAEKAVVYFRTHAGRIPTEQGSVPTQVKAIAVVAIQKCSVLVSPASAKVRLT